MGNSISDLTAEIDERHARRLVSTPPNADGSSPTPDCDHGRQASSSSTQSVHEESGFTELINLCEDIRAGLLGTGIDDRHMLLEKVLVWMAEHGDWPMEHRLESMVVDFLYKDLPHPPEAYLSEPSELPGAPAPARVPYAFRPADGANYNAMFPSLGKAGTPYARSVPSARAIPASALPDAGLVFDMLLKRDKFEPHPDGVSSLFFAFADLVIHSIFNTDRKDSTINNASSYLDLSPLYGSSEAQVDSVRRMDGTGRLKEDVFADGRLLFMPPSACALLILLCRNHNYIADKLLSINERGTFRAPEQLDAAARSAQDAELFARARLVNCGFFMQIILGDYVGAILGLVRDGHSWRLKILQPYRAPTGAPVPRAGGNAVSAEFNLMYRWHAALSAQDTAWVEAEFRGLFGDRDFAALTPADFAQAYARRSPRGDVQTWTFGGLKRAETGRFADVDLAKILQDATEAEAGAFRARGIPEVMKVVELMAIEQARNWGTCSLNEFRTFMGLKPYRSFLEWNPDHDVAMAAQMLYHDIDNLELYIGLQAEQTKTPQPGAGLCPGYTVSRAILSDAVCLTRGDRFMTTEFTPQNLTAWGYADCQFDVADGSYGGMLTKLLFRTLPDCYPAGSAYAHFPFLTPRRMRAALADRDAGLVAQYAWTRPALGAPPPRPEYAVRAAALTGHEGLHSRELERVLFGAPALEGHRASFVRFTGAQLRHQSLALGAGKRYVDVVRDIVNMVPIFWVATIIRPHAPEAHDEGKHYRPDKYFQSFADLADYVYINTNPASEFSLKARAAGVAASITRHIAGSEATAPGDLINRITRRLAAAMHVFAAWEALSPVSPTSEVLATARAPVPDDGEILAALRFEDVPCLSAHYVGELAATAALFARCVARVVDELLDGGAPLRAELARTDLLATDPGLVEAVCAKVEEMNDVGVSHGLMDRRFIETTVPGMLQCIFRLPNLQRAPGLSGRLHRVAETSDVKLASYQNSHGDVTPWPTSLTVEYSESPALKL
ncbi:linoleate 10R-lipoxygenase domain-containing protein [Phanerochaete sordida]|uniref:Linoleate 10R-lipoxygenase domain-containing protein n=1 Tax=Phanerochaete sordida TaxID=48140 RepID=A0A9P3GDG1_9APHY|nr:linoleate 10R-lipoxygenase domain-containing protein [Phanerochaete sordida]